MSAHWLSIILDSLEQIPVFIWKHNLTCHNFRQCTSAELNTFSLKVLLWDSFGR